MKLSIKKIILTAFLAVAILLPSAGLLNIGNVVGQAKAQGINLNSRFMHQRGFISVRTSNRFFRDQNMFRRYPMFRRYLPVRVYPRQVMIFDRDDITNQIFLSNSFTGPGSRNINRVVIGVNHSLFNRLANDYDLNQNIRIGVNTGNNTVSFNTISGNFSTGDVDITIR